MARHHELLRQLYSASNATELKNHIDAMVLSGNYEITRALSSFFLGTGISNIKSYIIRSMENFPDRRSAQRLLMEFLDDQDSNIRLEVIRSCQKLGGPQLSWRLMSIYRSTNREEKKIVILKYLISSGVSIFGSWFLDHFGQESTKIKYLILRYLTHYRLQNEEEEKKLLVFIKELLSDCSSEEEKIYLAGLLLPIFELQPELKKKAGSSAITGEPFSFLEYQLRSDTTTQYRSHFHKKMVEQLQREGAELPFILRFDPLVKEKLLEPVRKSLYGFEENYDTALHLFLRNLIYLSDERLTALLLDLFTNSEKFNFKQAILEQLIYFPFTAELEERFQSICTDLLKDTRHIRIFEVLSRTMILVFKNSGLKQLQEFFEETRVEEQKLAVLTGILSALHDYGYATEVTSFDQYHLNLVMGNILADLAEGPEKNRALIQRVLRIARLLNATSYEDELISLLEKYPPGPEFIKTMVSFNTEKSIQTVLSLLNSHVDNPLENEVLLHVILEQINIRRLKQAREIPSALLKKLLLHPLFTSEIIRFLYTYQVKELQAEVLNFTSSDNIHIQYQLIRYIESFAGEDGLDDLFTVFNNGDSFIRKTAGQVLFHSGNQSAMKRILNHYLVQKNRHQEPQWFIDTFPDHPQRYRLLYEVLVNFSELKIMTRLKEQLSLVSREFFLLKGREKRPVMEEAHGERMPEEEPVFIELTPYLNDEVVKSLHTAEGFYHFLQKEIRENRHNSETYHYIDVVREYRLFVFELTSKLIDDKLPSLLENNEYSSALTNIFKNAFLFVEFFQRENKWSNHNIDTAVLSELIRQVLEKKRDELSLYLETITRQLHLFYITLHHNRHYGLINPMKMPLDLMTRYDFVNILYRVNDNINTFSEDPSGGNMEELGRIRQDVIHLGRFYLDYHKLNS